jgi:hypothetical protein
MAKDTVVVADDDRTVVTMVAAFLRTKGFNVLPALPVDLASLHSTLLKALGRPDEPTAKP